MVTPEQESEKEAIRQLVELEAQRILRGALSHQADQFHEQMKLQVDQVRLNKEFIGSFARTVAIAFFGILIIAGVILQWVLGAQLDTTIARYGIDEKFTQTIDSTIGLTLSEKRTEFESELDTIKKSISDQIKTDAEEQVRSNAEQTIRDTVTKNIQQIQLGEVEEFLSTLLPSGAVMAFNGRCPEEQGWQPFTEAEGRFILGVGKGQRDGIFSLGTLGGQETHKLTIEEIPSHSHNTMGKGDNTWFLGIVGPPTHQGLRTGTFLDNDNYLYKTSTEGGNQAHNNMPPFIALYFCQKE